MESDPAPANGPRPPALGGFPVLGVLFTAPVAFPRDHNSAANSGFAALGLHMPAQVTEHHDCARPAPRRNGSHRSEVIPPPSGVGTEDAGYDRGGPAASLEAGLTGRHPQGISPTHTAAPRHRPEVPSRFASAASRDARRRGADSTHEERPACALDHRSARRSPHLPRGGGSVPATTPGHNLAPSVMPRIPSPTQRRDNGCRRRRRQPGSRVQGAEGRPRPCGEWPPISLWVQASLRLSA